MTFMNVFCTNEAQMYEHVRTMHVGTYVNAQVDSDDLCDEHVPLLSHLPTQSSRADLLRTEAVSPFSQEPSTILPFYSFLRSARAH